MSNLKSTEASQVYILSSSIKKEGIIFKLRIEIQSKGEGDYFIKDFQSESEKYQDISIYTFFLEDQRVTNIEKLYQVIEDESSFPILTIKDVYPNLTVRSEKALGEYLTKDKEYDNVFYFQALLPKDDTIIQNILTEISIFNTDQFNKSYHHYSESHLTRLLIVLSLKAIKSHI